jgi:hypothetical protein
MSATLQGEKATTSTETVVVIMFIDSISRNIQKRHGYEPSHIWFLPAVPWVKNGHLVGERTATNRTLMQNSTADNKLRRYLGRSTVRVRDFSLEIHS